MTPQLRRIFDEAADLYDRARPSYPQQVFDDLSEVTGLGQESAVFEIGCGTGQATKVLARRSGRVVCVELGARLAAVAQRNLQALTNVTVLNADFDSWKPGEARFNLVFAISSWHWLDPRSRFQNAAECLFPKGYLAIATNNHAFPADFDSFFSEIQPTYHEIGESADAWPPPLPDQAPDLQEEIKASGLFEDVLVKRYLWTVDYDAASYIDLLETYSGHRAMERGKRDRLYHAVRKLIDARPGKAARKHYLTILHVAQLASIFPIHERDR